MSHLAGKVKIEQPILVIFGNPPYSGISSNVNDWTEKLLKEDIDGCQSYYKIDGKPLGEKNPKWLQDDYVKFLRFAQWKIQKSGSGIVGMITNHSYLDNPTFRGMRQSLMKTFDEVYILDLHGNSLKKETTPDGGKDENVFDIRQGVAIALFVKNKDKKESAIYHADLYGLREDKYDWLSKHDFSKDNYTIVKPETPYYFFKKYNIKTVRKYLEWEKINEIFPLNGVGMTTARDKFVIDFDRNTHENRIRLFKNLKFDNEELHRFFEINKKKGWDIRQAWKSLQDISDTDLKNYILPVTYRPFDKRYIFWNDSIVWRTAKRIMLHMVEDNIGITIGRAGQAVGLEHLWNLVFISNSIIDLNLYYRGGAMLFPLYTYTDEKKKNLFNNHNIEREPNISPQIFNKSEEYYKRIPSPEEILYYIYGIFYSNIYRETYAEFLKIDFPRVPFTSDDNLFCEIGKLGKELADLHLLKSPLLDMPVARYQGEGDNDQIEKIDYNENEQCIYINNGKYFEGITPEVWYYHIGGYRVLPKYLKDRKGRILEDAPHYCRIVTALQKTIEIQKQVDSLYPEIEKELIQL